MQANILEALDELESCHQELKKEYLQWAKGKLPNDGIGAEHNPETLEVLEKCNAIEEINKKVDIIKNFIKNKDYQERYEIFREIYVIHPSFHELFSGVLDCSLFDFAPLDDEQIEAKITDLNRLSNPSPLDIKLKMPDLFEITRTLLEKTEYDALKTDKLLESDKWLYYAPCNINEGHIFKKKSDKSRIAILKEINSIDQSLISPADIYSTFHFYPLLSSLPSPISSICYK